MIAHYNFKNKIIRLFPLEVDTRLEKKQQFIEEYQQFQNRNN